MILPIRQLNYLKEFWFDPCDAPLTVYARAFIPAFLILLITWFMPDISNILFNATRPTKALAKRRSGRKGRGGSKAGKPRPRWMRLNPFLFDQDEWIGKKIGATTNFQQRSIGGLEWRLWLVFGVLERIGYRIFVINAVTDFLYNWMSIAEKSEFCMAQRAMVLVREEQNGIHIGAPGWYGLYCPHVLKQRGIISGYSSVYIPAGQWITVSAGGSGQSTNPDIPASLEVRMRTSNGITIAGKTDVAEDGTFSFEAEGRVRGPQTVWVEARTIGWNVNYSGVIAAHGIPSPVGR